jgi:hypothetical protein
VWRAGHRGRNLIQAGVAAFLSDGDRFLEVGVTGKIYDCAWWRRDRETVSQAQIAAIEVLDAVHSEA